MGYCENYKIYLWLILKIHVNKMEIDFSERKYFKVTLLSYDARSWTIYNVHLFGK